MVYNIRMSVHLHVRSCYTLLESTIRIPALAAKAAEYGYSAIALTDRNVLYGVPSFIRACRQYGIRPIVGMEAVCHYHEFDVPFLLLAKDNAGYKNLIRLSSILCNGDETCTPEQLKQHSSHCFMIAYGEGGWLDSDLVSANMSAAAEKLKIMREELGSFDVALSYQDALLWKDRNAALKQLCLNMGIRTAAVNKICYLDKEDAGDFRILSGIRSQRNLDDPTLPHVRGRHLLTKEEMMSLYEADDLARTDEIAAECRGDYVLEKTGLPLYQGKNGMNAREYLPALCAAGLKKRLGGISKPEYTARLQYELGVIEKMHFENYFLIVYDFIRHARKEGIYIGPGRGSAAGSLVAYCLGITQVDPIQYGLLFERFLNPERISMPDIDTDIPDDRRADVIRYVYEKYGREHVADIVTFGTLGARQVIRDVAKISGISQRDTDMLTRLIGNRPKTTLASAYQENPRLRQAVDASEKLKKLYQSAMRLEGLPRHTSTHAAGIVMSKLPLEDIVPTMSQSDDMKTVQYTMEYLEDLGLIKMDFLGLRNLTIIDDIAKKIQNDDPDFRIMDIPLDDAETYELFAKADTAGVFQFESEGMKNLLRKLKPVNFEDMTAALALFRPASAESIPMYIENKNNPGKIRYPLPQLEPVLKSTYGIMIFQEQAMSTAQIAAGFSLGRADVLRKAMSKKKEDELNNLRGEFMAGCRKRNVDESTAAQLFDLVSRFGGYGFNRSHAVAYGMVAYQTAYVKAHYPLYFYMALFDSVIGDEFRSSQYADECRRRGIRVCPPDINESCERCMIKDGAIVLPLSFVRQVGVHAAAEIIDERNVRGRYEDFYDFTARMLIRKISRQVIEQLIDAGALDCFNMGRRTLKASLDEAVAYGELIQVNNGTQMTIDLGLVSKPVPIKLKDDRDEMIENEKNALGFCLGEQPIVAVRERNGIDLPTLSVLMQMKGKVSGFAQIRSVKQHRTKRGEMMAFLKLADETGQIDMAVMPRLYSQTAAYLLRGTYIRFNAKISEEGSLLADSIAAVRGK